MADKTKDEVDDRANEPERPTPRDVDPASVETGGLSKNEIIARRSPDIHTKAAKKNEHVKVFVLPPGPKPIESNGYDHSANMAATVQYAISQGMRPKKAGIEGVRLVGIEQHRNGISWEITYAVAVDVVEDGLDPSGPDVVTGGEDVSTNTDKAGHSSDTSGTPAGAPASAPSA